ncbi:MAG: pitrilysin family protein [Bdellovibrionota bacterium]
MVQKFLLSNKLKVLLVENHKAPVVTIQTWVKTGSADEVTGQEGLSHFIEHLLFKGTKKYKVGEVAKLIEGAGGELNAYTSFDQTVFYMTLSSQFVDLGLDAMSEMVGRPLFDKIEVDNEREVVIEEIKRSNDSPSRKSSRLLFESVYKNYPYSRPVIGYDHIVNNTPVEKIKKLFHDRYCPENMYLLIVGDFNSADLKKKIKAQFSDLKGKLKIVKRPKEPAQTEAIIAVEKSTFNESYLNIAWKTLNASKDELIGLDLLSYILSYGDNTRLIQSLRLKNPLVNEIGASQFSSIGPGFFSITAYLDYKNLEATLDETANELAYLIAEEPFAEELKKAITQLESTEYYHETMDSIARKVGNNQFLYNDPNHFQIYLKKMKSMKPEYLSKLAKKYFSAENMTLTLVYPEKEKDPTALLSTWVEDYKTTFDSFKAEKILKSKNPVKQESLEFKKNKIIHKSTDLKVIEHKSGAKIFFQPIEGTHVVSARTGFLGGLRADPKNKIGTSELISKTWLSGTKTKTESQISDILETNAAHMSPYSGRNSFGLHFQMLNQVESKIGNLLEDVIINSAFPATEFEREKEILTHQLKTLNDHPSSLVFMDFMKCLYGEHPYSNETYGTLETLSKIGQQDLSKLVDTYVNPKNFTACVAGGFDENYWMDLFDKMISKMNRGERFEKKFEHDTIMQDQKTFKVLDKEQSHIVYGFKGLSMYDERRHALTVMQTILSGQGGRLFMNLRDKASLAYSVSPVRMDGIETGYFGAYIGCSPNKGKKALEMMKVEFDTLMDKKIPQEELDRAKQNIIGKHDIGTQKTSNVSSLVLFDEIYGIPHKTPKEFAERIKSITANDIQKLAQHLFSQHSVKSAVGPECPW